MAKEGKSGSGFFWGFVLGLIVGGILAILYAPQPGDETRQQLSEQSIELRKRSQLRAEQLATQVRERYSDAMIQANEAYNRTKEEVLTRYNQAKKA
ncbi:MAG TPA: YtxH domain-containing protein [Ktedonobacterales bacterium]